MLVTLFGTAIPVKLLHPRNALLPMLTTVLGIDTLTSAVQL